MLLSELVVHFKPFPEIVIFDENSEEEISLYDDDFNEVYQKWSSCEVVEWESYFNSNGNTILCITNWRF